jgi:FkbM family methyltransferase
MELSLINSAGGDLFIDVGAYVGDWTFALHEKFRKTLAFEPNPIPYQNLLKRVNSKKVCLINAAASDNDGSCDFLMYHGLSHGTILLEHPIQEIAAASNPKQIKVKTIKIDSIVPKSDRLDLLKIDVEGSAPFVIRGAIGMIRSCRPSMVIEIHSEKEKQDILHELPEFNFHVTHRYQGVPLSDFFCSIETNHETRDRHQIQRRHGKGISAVKGHAHQDEAVDVIP